MKVFIDKHGGIQYHKEDCRIMIGRSVNSHVNYTYAGDLAYQKKGDYPDLIVSSVVYYPCPYCFPKTLVGTIDSHFYEYGGINE